MISFLLFLAIVKLALFTIVIFYATGDKAAKNVALGLAVFELLNIIYFFMTLG